MHTVLFKCVFIIGIIATSTRAQTACSVANDPVVLADCLRYVTSAAWGAARQDLKIICGVASDIARCVQLEIRDCLGEQIGAALLTEVHDLAVNCCPDRNNPRCSIQDYRIQAQRCFAADSLVTLADRSQKPISQLQSGDVLLAFNHQTKQIVTTPFLTMLDFQPHHFALFKQVTTVSGRQLSLTSSHLLLTDQQSSDEYIMAKNLQSGMNIYVMNEQGMLVSEQVANVSDVVKQGYMAPLTNEGTVIVNDVAASCYATINSHDIAHAVLSPMRWWYNMFGQSKEMDGKIGVHWFAKILYEMTTFLIPSIIHF